jgi:hypothetical protein
VATFVHFTLGNYFRGYEGLKWQWDLSTFTAKMGFRTLGLGFTRAVLGLGILSEMTYIIIL